MSGAPAPLTLNSVCMRYRPDLPLVLNNVSISAADGKILGICGRTGCGKSSLVRILAKFIQHESGEVRVFGALLQSLSRHALRGKVSFVFQEPMLFSGTVRSNIDPTGLSDSAVIHAAQTAKLSDAGLSLDTVLSDRGTALSVGQRQLLALARGLALGAPILVLDEAGSNVDEETDSKLGEAVKSSGCTSLIVAHRIPTLMMCDEVVVLDQVRCRQLSRMNPTKCIRRER